VRNFVFSSRCNVLIRQHIGLFVVCFIAGWLRASFACYCRCKCINGRTIRLFRSVAVVADLLWVSLYCISLPFNRHHLLFTLLHVPIDSKKRGADEGLTTTTLTMSSSTVTTNDASVIGYCCVPLLDEDGCLLGSLDAGSTCFESTVVFVVMCRISIDNVSFELLQIPSMRRRRRRRLAVRLLRYLVLFFHSTAVSHRLCRWRSDERIVARASRIDTRRSDFFIKITHRQTTQNNKQTTQTNKRIVSNTTSDRILTRWGWRSKGLVRDAPTRSASVAYLSHAAAHSDGRCVCVCVCVCV
jgi:hypothetical protein